MRRGLILPLLLVAAAACTSNPLPSVPAPTAPIVAEPATAQDDDGQFRLTFELDSMSWAAGEPITGTATLERLGSGEVISGSGGGPFGFNYSEVGGRRHIQHVMTGDCVPHELTQEAPIVESLSKSGGWSADDPDADFYSDFMKGREVRLPAGNWDITAAAVFDDGPGCTLPGHTLTATIRVTITP